MFTPQFDGMTFVILSGASGSGKTVIAEGVAARYGEQVDVHHSDTIGVPTPERMIAEWGSGEGWQRAMTYEWIGRIGTARRMGCDVLLEGQMRLSFVAEAAAAAGIKDYRLILVDCDDATRTNRLSLARRQENLATAAMMNWAEYLRGEATRLRCTIFDTSLLSLDDCVQWAWSQLRQ
jgi:RNase adaptor protein for sRNA GlmZ degradation